VERSEFELPVPVSKLSDDGIKLEFVAGKRIALIARDYNTVGATAHQPVLAGRWRRYPKIGGFVGPRYLSDLRNAGLK
jgi:hypothetical protein